MHSSSQEGSMVIGGEEVEMTSRETGSEREKEGRKIDKWKRGKLKMQTAR